MSILDRFRRTPTVPQRKTIVIDEFVIDEETGEMLEAPKDRSKYVIPSVVKSISGPAQSTMYKANEIVFPDDSQLDFDNEKNFNFIERSYRIRTIKIPDTLKKIPFNIDREKMNETGVDFNIPSELEEMYYNAIPRRLTHATFKNLKRIVDGDVICGHNGKLEYLEISGPITTLPNIYQTTKLKELVIGEGITKTATSSNGVDRAYYGLNELRIIHIPSSLDSFTFAHQDIRGISVAGEHIDTSAEPKPLTIYKTINGKVYIFEVMRGNYLNISFNGKQMSFINEKNQTFEFDISGLKENICYVVDIEKGSIQQKSEIKKNQASEQDATLTSIDETFTSIDETFTPIDETFNPIDETFNPVGVTKPQDRDKIFNFASLQTTEIGYNPFDLITWDDLMFAEQNLEDTFQPMIPREYYLYFLILGIIKKGNEDSPKEIVDKVAEELISKGEKFGLPETINNLGEYFRYNPEAILEDGMQQFLNKRFQMTNVKITEEDCKNKDDVKNCIKYLLIKYICWVESEKNGHDATVANISGYINGVNIKGTFIPAGNKQAFTRIGSVRTLMSLLSVDDFKEIMELIGCTQEINGKITYDVDYFVQAIDPQYYGRPAR